MRAALYCRLSEEDRNKLQETDDSESIQNQKTMLIQYAADHDWDIYNIYSDDDYTGSDRNRPAFKQLVADAETRKFDIILCKTQSRFTREMELVEKYIHGLFPLWKIRFVSVVDNADTENKGNKKARQINGLINEWYLEDMSENIKSVLTSRRKSGLHIGSFALYGYKKDPERKGYLIIDDEAAAVVREVFTLFASGYGKTAIARVLNDRGVPNPTEYKRLSGLRYKPPKTKQSTLWKYFAIANMLTNEIYIGNMVQGKYGSISFKSKANKPNAKEQWIRVKNTHEAIIDEALWDRVQQLAKEKHKPFKVGQIGILAKKVVCAHCGYTMRSSKNRGLYYLKCPTKHVGGECIGSFVSVNTLEKLVLTELVRMNEDYLDKDALAQKVIFLDNCTAQMTKIESDIAAYQKKIGEYAVGIKNSYLDKAKGLITDAEFLEFTKDFSSEKARLEKLVQASQEQLASVEMKIQTADSHREQLDQYLSLEQLDRMMVETMIDYISVSRRDPETKQLPIEIYWNF